MELHKFELKDIKLITELIPPGWETVIPSLHFYTQSDFCFPIKIMAGHKIVGIGCTIVHQDSAWLGHIIVHPDYRNQRIGKFITESLVDIAYSKNCETIYLLATELGEPVYRKIGFEVETEYLFMKAEEKRTLPLNSEHILSFKDKFKQALLEMDQQVSGESRVHLLEPHLSDGFVYLQDKELKGYYLPGLGEGLIIATDTTAGIELMKLRLSNKDIAVFPIEHSIARSFLNQYGLKELKTQKRMRLGKKRSWQASNLYNRIGGNLG